MSGFVGIVLRNRAAVERRSLQRMTDFLKFRGPDAQHIWLDGQAGFGHTLLKTTAESEHQPFSLDGKTWIVADCRLDARDDLISALQTQNRANLQRATDSELILRAYQAWGKNCAAHLLGDFAFAIWDGPHQRLLCARDHFGVKPFYYSSVGSRFVFSNTLECVRQHPSISNAINDLAIADFLMFDMIRDTAATSFADVHRLPPAHFLICSEEGVSVQRYWTLPVSSPLYYKQPSECVEQFQELFDRSVADRLRTNRAGVFMSGGLDSSTVAATAHRKFLRNGIEGGLCAYTEIFERLIPHEECRYAKLVAEALKIPIELCVNDQSGLWESSNSKNHRWPEPVHLPWSDGGIGELRHIAETRRVALTGFGGDPALSCLLTVHFRELLRKRQFGRAVADAVRYFAADGRSSRLYIQTRLNRWFPGKRDVPHYPPWLNQDLEKRLALRERWEAMNHPAAPNEAVRPVAYEAMADPMWASLFEGYDPGVTGVPVEVRHPFFDLRLVNFMMALPALPWCSDKELLREAARDILPDAVRLRRKSPLMQDPLIALLQRPHSSWVDSFKAVPELARYVQRELIRNVFRERDVWTAWIHLRPLSLNFWLLSKDSAV